MYMYPLQLEELLPNAIIYRYHSVKNTIVVNEINEEMYENIKPRQVKTIRKISRSKSWGEMYPRYGLS